MIAILLLLIVLVVLALGFGGCDLSGIELYGDPTTHPSPPAEREDQP